MADGLDIAVVIFVFLVGGTIKGVVGFGLPNTAIALLTLYFEPVTAMGILLIPAVITNLWQSFTKGFPAAVLARIWPLLIAIVPGVWFSTGYLEVVEPAMLYRLLGTLLVVYAVSTLAGARLTSISKNIIWTSPLIGIINGVFTGLSGVLGVPAMLLLQSLEFKRVEMRQALGLLFLTSSSCLMAALYLRGILSVQSNTLSVIAVLPAVAGMMIGSFLSRYLSETQFRTYFLVGLALLGMAFWLKG